MGIPFASHVRLGHPPLYVLQKVTGASRPSDGSGSQWHFNNDTKEVSGHASIGAIPFLVKAEMVDNPCANSLATKKTDTKFTGMYNHVVPRALKNGTGMVVEDRW
jgi:hypothetical protein